MMKRLFDVIASTVGIVVFSPLFLLVAAIIKMTSCGPIFFSQERVGRHEKPFLIRKFRTMIADADLRGPSITTKEDKRITKVGKYLRKYKLDELPQLFNVLSGDMSFVGPRPELAKYVNYYPIECKKIIFSVRPGITDWGSIRFRDENNLLNCVEESEKFYVQKILPEKLEHYVKYAENNSFTEDLKIIFATICAILKSDSQ